MTIAEILRGKAASLQSKIDQYLANRKVNTQRRAHEDRLFRREGETLRITQCVMYRLADLNDSRDVPDCLRDWRELSRIETAVRVVRNAERFGNVMRLTEEQNAIRSLIPMENIQEGSPLNAQPDVEYEPKLDAQRVTVEFASKSTRNIDGGKQPITDGPLFGGPAQMELFS